MKDREKFEKDHPGASDECPTFFRACIRRAQKGGSLGYAEAAYQLIGAVETIVYGDVEGEVLEAFTVLTDAEAHMAWLDTYLPRCMALVPRRRRESFMAGIQRWLDEQ